MSDGSKPDATPKAETTPEVMRIAQPPCPAVLYVGDSVVVACSQPAGHATMPGHPSLHSIVLQWQEEVSHVNPGNPPVT